MVSVEKCVSEHNLGVFNGYTKTPINSRSGFAFWGHVGGTSMGQQPIVSRKKPWRPAVSPSPEPLKSRLDVVLQRCAWSAQILLLVAAVVGCVLTHRARQISPKGLQLCRPFGLKDEGGRRKDEGGS